MFRVMFVLSAWLVVSGLMPLGIARADEILFTNGDRLTGTITRAVGGKMTIKTEAAGAVTVDMSKVQTFSTEGRVRLQVGSETVVDTRVAPGAPGTVRTAPERMTGTTTVAIKDVTGINPPPVKWTGSITANGMMTRGNSETENIGVTIDAVRRAKRDRISLGAGYNYGRQKDPDSGERAVTTDNWFAFGKYDYFLTKPLYVYLGARAERDRIAKLNLRLSPGAGVGYQWFETPVFNLSTEGGLSWVYRDFENEGSDNHLAGRLAYHVDWRPHVSLRLFHSLEYLPSLENPSSDYNLNADAGVRATVISDFFTEFRSEWRYDGTPAPGAEKSDFRLSLGVGWTF